MNNKIEKLQLKELIGLRNELEYQVKRMRAEFGLGMPSAKFNEFNSLLLRVNQEIENKIRDEFFQ